MRPSVVKAASVRLAASVLALLAAPAFAGDAANFAALGFSADGRYFGYEEFGVQDGSGFPYSNIFILDVTEDKWVGGSPFRVRLEDESPGLAGVRAEAMQKAGAKLAKDRYGSYDRQAVDIYNAMTDVAARDYQWAAMLAAAPPPSDGNDWQGIGSSPPPEQAGYIDVRSITTYRWLPYKKDGQRQRGTKGRWQVMTSEYGGWQNTKLPGGDWRPNRPLPPPPNGDEKPDSRLSDDDGRGS